MTGYSKLFSSIVTSSIWCEDDVVLRVWIAMLATCDAHGVVEGAVPGFASLARVSVPDMRRALEVLTSPDPDSRTPDHDGRRLDVIPGGWRVLNYSLYRNKLQDKPGSKAAAMRESRQRKAEARGGNALPKVTIAASAYPGGSEYREEGNSEEETHPGRHGYGGGF